jgi:hypothetical protein
LLWARLRLHLLLALLWRGRGWLILSWRRRLLRAHLRLNLLLTLRRRGRRWLVLSRRRRLLRARLRLNLLLALSRRSRSWLVLSWRRRLLRARLRLNLLLALRRWGLSWFILRRRRRLLRARLRLDLLLARGWLRSGRLITIGWLLGWHRGRRWLRARPRGGRLIAIGLNILLGWSRLLRAVWLASCVGLLRCVRWRSGLRWSRSWSGTRGNYRRDGFALRGWLCHSYDNRLAMIDSGKLLAILRGLVAMLNLSGHRRNALLARGG